ncbi:MAG: MarR family transcriptional regulator [Gammaproteobacteria bacterium]|nr:MAG: MarR family transcriptional regulator [Gammaproteobacteria bacterium]
MDVNHSSPPQASPCTCAILRRTARRVTRLYDQALRPAGLRLTQFALLANIARDGGLSITALAERLEMDRTTLTRNLRPLMQAGWVLVATGSDRRQRSVGLTQAGRRIYEQAYPLWQEAERRLRRDLGQDNSEALRRLLNTTLERTAAS